jgi:hypothetical protein
MAPRRVKRTGSAEDTVSMPDSVRAQVMLFVVCGPLRWRALRRAVERAGGVLPSDPLYPASPAL